jgi:carbamoyltransferase
MLFTTRLKQEHRKDLARNYKNLDPMLKLASERSEFQAITHVDFSSRLQTVNNKTNPLIYSLLEEFKKKSGFPMLVNTSFNVRGEPIVCNPTDAIKCFLNSGIDLLVMSNFVVDKSRLVDIDLSSYEVEFPKD